LCGAELPARDYQKRISDWQERMCEWICRDNHLLDDKGRD